MNRPELRLNRRSAYLPVIAWITVVILSVLQFGCASTPQTPDCPAGTQDLPDCPPRNAVVDEEIEFIYDYRTWKSPKEIGEDPIAFGMNADIPIKGARGKVLGPDDEGGVDSLAALKSCEGQAAFIRTEAGQISTRKARVQVMVFNAISKISTSPNRRSHDKMLIIDGDFHDKAFMMTGAETSHFPITA